MSSNFSRLKSDFYLFLKRTMTENETPIIPTHEFTEETDMQAFRANPSQACEGMQKKYLGMTHDEFLPHWEELKDHEGEVPDGYELVEELHKNPFTHEEKTIKILREKEKQDPEKIIDEKIQELKLKVVLWTITKEEKQTLELLTK